MVIYWQFVTLSIAKSVWNTGPEDEAQFSEAVGWTGLVNGFYNIVTFCTAFLLVGWAAKYGAKRVHAMCLTLAAVGLIIFPSISNQYLLFIPIGLGIAWASIMGVPYILAIAMLWVSNPRPDEESPIMPLGGGRDISVYDRVIVGSDGSPASMYAVDRAYDVAAAAEAHTVVVSAFSPDSGGSQETVMVGGRQVLRGEAAAREALRTSVAALTDHHAKRIEQRIEGDPASALIAAAGNNPANLIVVGNRGLGAADGEVLGSVPAEVVRNATCDVLNVQVSALNEPSHSADPAR